MSFINFNNLESGQVATYSKEEVRNALLLIETKSEAKASQLVAGLNERVELNEALELFSDKLNALGALKATKIDENYEVIFSDGVSQMKKFRSEAQAIDFMKKEIASNKKLRDIAVYKPGMHSTTQTELVVSFWGNGSYLDNVSKKDSSLAAKKLEEAIVAEDWGTSDQAAMNKSIHRDAGNPRTMPSPFDSKLRAAAESAVDFYWDDWEEYQKGGREDLIDNAVRSYLRSYFPKDWATLVRMFEPMESVVTEAKYDKKKLLKLIKNQDDAEILVNGKWYIIYNPDNGNDENTEMWAADDYIYALDPDGEEYQIKYKDIEQFKESVEVNEADMNDPVLIAFRAAKAKREAEMAKPKRKPLYGKQRQKAEDDLWYISQELKDLYADRGQMLIDMEQEAEVEGGPIADEYGDKLNKIEDEIQKLITKRNKLEMMLAESFVNEAEVDIIPEVEGEFMQLYSKLNDLAEETTDTKWRKAIEGIIKGLEGVENKIGGYANKLGIVPTHEGNAFGDAVRKAKEAGEEEFELDGETYKVEEGRSINKIQKEWAEVTSMMKSTVDEWKKAEGDSKAALLDKLKSLTARKNELEKELNSAVQLKDVDAELVGESKDFDQMALDILGDLSMEFDPWEIADMLPKDAEDTVDGYYPKMSSSDKKKLSKALLLYASQPDVWANESKKLSWEGLIENVTKTNEDLRTDLKKYIKANEKELNELADEDNWDGIYDMLRSEFNVKEGSKEDDDLITTFNFIF